MDYGVVYTVVVDDAIFSDAGSDSFKIACCLRMRLSYKAFKSVNIQILKSKKQFLVRFSNARDEIFGVLRCFYEVLRNQLHTLIITCQKKYFRCFFERKKQAKFRNKIR
jgi:hypothetical protein